MQLGLNNPEQLKRVLSVLEAVQQRFNQQHQGGDASVAR